MSEPTVTDEELAEPVLFDALTKWMACQMSERDMPPGSVYCWRQSARTVPALIAALRAERAKVELLRAELRDERLRNEKREP